jgi:hypothetical protein
MLLPHVRSFGQFDENLYLVEKASGITRTLFKLNRADGTTRAQLCSRSPRISPAYPRVFELNQIRCEAL